MSRPGNLSRYGKNCRRLCIWVTCPTYPTNPPQRSFITFHHSHSHPRNSMSSSSSSSNVSSSFQNIFDAALRAFTQKTGSDIATHPLITRLECCDSPEAILKIFEEKAHSFNQFSDGDRKNQLWRPLKLIVDILHGQSISGVFQDFGLVRLIKSIPL